MDIECDKCGEVFGEGFHRYIEEVEVNGEVEEHCSSCRAKRCAEELETETRERLPTLIDLFNAMKADDDSLPRWDSLPTYGGDEITDTESVWSWNETHMIVGDGQCDLEIVSREDWNNRSK